MFSSCNLKLFAVRHIHYPEIVIVYFATTCIHIVSATAFIHRTARSSIPAISSLFGLSSKCRQFVMMCPRSHVAATTWQHSKHQEIITCVPVKPSSDHFHTDAVVPSSDHCRTEIVLSPSGHYCIEAVPPSGDHYCIAIVVPSSDHCCTETVSPSNDLYGTTKIASPSDHLHAKRT